MGVASSAEGKNDGMSTAKPGRVLIIAGSDSGGGAGIQADIKAVTALGGYAMTAVTALTIQNTLGVHGVVPAPLDAVRGQIDAVADDLGVDAVKTGMLATTQIVELVAEALMQKTPGAPKVVDPVMVAKGGHRLLERKAVDAVRTLMAPLASLITPNAPEAEALTGKSVETLDGQRRAGERLLESGARAVLVKGGHVPGDRIVDVLATHHGEFFFEGPRIATSATHGTGCTLASAIAAGLAGGYDLRTSVSRARVYLQGAIRNAPGYGAGAGPLDHAWTLREVLGDILKA